MNDVTINNVKEKTELMLTNQCVTVGFLLVFYRNFVQHAVFQGGDVVFSNTVTVKSETNVTQGQHSIERIWLLVDVRY